MTSRRAVDRVMYSASCVLRAAVPVWRRYCQMIGQPAYLMAYAVRGDLAVVESCSAVAGSQLPQKSASTQHSKECSSRWCTAWASSPRVDFSRKFSFPMPRTCKVRSIVVTTEDLCRRCRGALSVRVVFETQVIQHLLNKTRLRKTDASVFEVFDVNTEIELKHDKSSTARVERCSHVPECG